MNLNHANIYKEGRTLVVTHKDLKGKLLHSNNESIMIAFKSIKSIFIFTYLKPDTTHFHIQTLTNSWQKFIDEHGEYNVSIVGDVNTSHNSGATV